MLTTYDHAYALRCKEAARGSIRLKNAILRSLGYRIPVQPKKRLVAPVFQKPPVKMGRPIGSTKTRARNPEIDRIQLCASRYCRVRIENLRGKRRGARFVRARQISMYLARKTTPSSYLDLAFHFGRDHTTIIHGVQKIEQLVDARDQRTIRALNAILARLGE